MKTLIKLLYRLKTKADLEEQRTLTTIESLTDIDPRDRKYARQTLARYILPEMERRGMKV